MIFLLFFTVISEETFSSAASNNATIASDFINVRSGPGLSYDVLDKLDHGKQLEILSSSEEWLQVKYDGRTGWVASWLVTYTNEALSTEHTEIISQTDGLNFRSNPSIDAPILTRMNAGERAKLLSDDGGDWLHVELNGMNGWVYAQYTSIVTDKKEEKEPDKQATKVEEEQPTETTIEKQNETYETFTVAVDTLNVRKNANQSSKKIAVIHKDEKYPITQTDGNWVKIKINDKKEGWVYAFHGNLTRAQTASNQTNSTHTATKKVTILSNGTNIRKETSTSAEIVTRANAGDQFPIVAEHGDWYEISLVNGETAFLANWVVSVIDGTATATKKKKAKRIPGTLNGLTIVVDPGHGGNDRGTTGVRGTFEKTITLKTAELLAAKLKSAGATVHLTRETDRYISLQDRVWTGLQKDADAFISLHYDANPNPEINGFTTYYQHPNQATFAKAIDSGLNSTVSLKNRGVQPADYYVLRKNKENAVLIELGFLSNASEEMTINTNKFREQATYGIYTGILNYFDAID